MTTSNDERDQHDERPDEQGGQVSESAKPVPEAGGADATDKSTGTAADRADQPDD